MRFRELLKNRQKLTILLYIFLVAFGILFLTNNLFLIKIGFFSLGGVLIISATLLLIYYFKNKNIARKYTMALPIKNGHILYFFLIIMTLISGISIIVAAINNDFFYRSTLASVFMFMSFQRAFLAYINKKRMMQNVFIIYTVLAIISFSLFLFFSMYSDMQLVINLVAGVALILEGAVGLFFAYRKRGFYRIKKRTKQQTNNSHDFKTFHDTDEIIITDYEIIDDNKDS